jgi:lipid II:glycine glycyltransferase (peptidoglycan interpeptide bridge formation enzyme)
VKSWTGTRLVSVPFSDHCEPLVNRIDDRREILAHLRDGVADGAWKYVELRPRDASFLAGDEPGDLRPVQRYCLHRLDLTPDVEELYQQLHPSCVRRAIRRAAREGMEYEAGSSRGLLSRFYRLLRGTRRRHGLPPQPLAWFEHLMACLRESLTIRVASKAGRPVAAMLTLSSKGPMVYKYGCSDARYHRLGGLAFLFWRAIQEAKQQGLRDFDLGRSDLDQPGLIAFKDRLGARRSTLIYYRQPATATDVITARKQRAARWLFGHLPDPALSLAGRLLYRHFG